MDMCCLMSSRFSLDSVEQRYNRMLIGWRFRVTLNFQVKRLGSVFPERAHSMLRCSANATHRFNARVGARINMTCGWKLAWRASSHS